MSLPTGCCIRGRQETMFLGSDIIRPLIRKLVPKRKLSGGTGFPD